MERNSSGALCIAHVRWLPVVLRPSAAAPLTTRPPAAPAKILAPLAPLPLFSACESVGSSVAVLRPAMRVCSLAAVLRPSCCGLRAAAFGRSTSGGAASRAGRTGASGATQRGIRPHCGAAESGFTGRRRRLGRALYPPTDVGFTTNALLLWRHRVVVGCRSFKIILSPSQRKRTTLR
jgi:hypothetical protein